MFKNLDSYLKEIKLYLVSKEDKDDILQEIRSHILDETENKFGEVTEKNLDTIIAEYGHPQNVAAKYSDNYQIIEPTFKNYLFIYTGIFFAIHFGLTIIASVTGQSFLTFFFIYIPSLKIYEMFLYIPTIFIFDLGLVGVILYLRTQKHKNIKLPFTDKIAESKENNGYSLSRLIAKILIFSVLIIVLFNQDILIRSTHDSIRIYTIPNFITNMISLAFLVEIIAAFLTYFTKSQLINVIKSFVTLVIFGIIMNFAYSKASIYSTNVLAARSIFVLLTIIFVFTFIKRLVKYTVTNYYDNR